MSLIELHVKHSFHPYDKIDQKYGLKDLGRGGDMAELCQI